MKSKPTTSEDLRKSREFDSKQLTFILLDLTTIPIPEELNWDSQPVILPVTELSSKLDPKFIEYLNSLLSAWLVGWRQHGYTKEGLLTWGGSILHAQSLGLIFFDSYHKIAIVNEWEMNVFLQGNFWGSNQ